MDIQVDIEFVCADCGNDLYGTQNRNGTIEISPCDKCLQEALEEGEKNATGDKL